MTAEEQTAIPWNCLPPSRQSCQPSIHQQDTHQLVTLLKRTRKPMPSRQLPVTRKSWNRRSSGAASNSARRRKSSRPGQRRRPEHGTRQLSCPGASRARQVRHGRRPPPALPARAVSSLARPRRPVRKPWAVGGAGKGQLQSRVAANGRPRLGSHAGTGAAGRRAGGQRRQAAPRAASGGCRGAHFRPSGSQVVEEAVIKLLYKPGGLLINWLYGVLAGAIVNRVWTSAARADDAPKATDAQRRWKSSQMRAHAAGIGSGGCADV